MSHITREEVTKIAHLSRIKLSEEETDLFAKQLEDILGYVAKLGEVDVEGVEPFLNAAADGNVFREDVVIESLPRDAALANAPERKDAFFKVPAVQ
jgi:aspartyl-tRNA(Asn)/glutamyl-tRNA(Gln) amidotransferase subunit C